MDSTVITMMHAVRGFFRFAHIHGLIPSDPAVYARLPHGPSPDRLERRSVLRVDVAHILEELASDDPERGNCQGIADLGSAALVHPHAGSVGVVGRRNPRVQLTSA